MIKRNQADLAERIRRGVPETTGVYLFWSGAGRVMYVGKSVNLRRRMLSYFLPGGPGRTIRTSVMVHGVTDFSFVPTSHELLALLLEDHLIKRELPEYNTRQREFDEYRYLLLTDDEYPALRMICREERGQSGHVFGPFRDRYFAEDLRRLIQDVFHLRACTERAPVRKSAQYDLGKCEGPCRGLIDVGRYARIVDHVAAFLGGDDCEIVHQLQGEMKAAASRREYEVAAECKRRRDLCRRFCARQSFLESFRRETLFVREAGDDRTMFVFKQGRLVRPHLHPEADRTLEDQDEDSRFVFDRGNLVYDWMRRRGSACKHRFDRRASTEG